MLYKEGVRPHGLHWRMRKVLKVADSVWRLYGRDCVCTSACDGEHSMWSWHYFGCAVDLRTRYFDGSEVAQVVRDLRAALGPDYEIIVHSGSHIHVEWEPYAPETR